MAWIDATTMAVQRTEQLYTKIDDTHFRFRSADFEAILEVDDKGIVTNYPGLFMRADPS
jgi:hypothetical protein